MWSAFEEYQKDEEAEAARKPSRHGKRKHWQSWRFWAAMQ